MGKKTTTAYLNVEVLQCSSNVVEKPFLINTVYLKQSVRRAQGIIHANFGLL